MLRGFHLDGTNLLKFLARVIHFQSFQEPSLLEKDKLKRLTTLKNLNLKKSEFYILIKEEIIKTDEFNFQKNDLKKLVDYELGKMKSSGEEPPHVKLMREKKLADYEPSADIGHLRWYPKGRLIRDLLSDYVYNLVTERGAMPVETPIMYDLSDDAIRVHAEKFGERQYRMGTKNKELDAQICLLLWSFQNSFRFIPNMEKSSNWDIRTFNLQFPVREKRRSSWS